MTEARTDLAARAWAQLLECVRRELPEETFRTWLAPTKALELKGHTITVAAPDRFAAEWNDAKHSSLLASYGPIALGHPITVKFTVDEDSTVRPQMDFFVAAPPEVATQHTLGNQELNPRYTFENFVIGKSNELAAAAAQAVAAAPGKVYNPLFIYGHTGLGKTHLMQAIGHEILLKDRTLRIRFIGTEQFTNELVAAIQSRSTQQFRRRFREIDLLLVDDIHFLKGKEATQEEFFHTFNALYEGGRQIILTSDRTPSDILGLEARLVSRFQWGMVADIEPPDFEHRTAILRNKALLDHSQLAIPDEVLSLIAQKVCSSVRELEGSIIRLVALASLRRTGITAELAHEALRTTPLSRDPETQSGPSSVIAIQELVAHEWGTTRHALCSKVRTHDVLIPRQVAMYLIRELLQTQLVEIGSAFGGRDHSTVIHSLERIATCIKQDTQLRLRIERLQALFSRDSVS